MLPIVPDIFTKLRNSRIVIRSYGQGDHFLLSFFKVNCLTVLLSPFSLLDRSLALGCHEFFFKRILAHVLIGRPEIVAACGILP